MKKRVLSMFMALVLCLTLLPAPVRAEEDTPEGGAIVQEEQQEEAPAAESPAILEQAAENGIAVQDGEDSTVENAVAEVTIDGTTTQYATLTEAITAAQNSEGSTVKLLADVTTTTQIVVDSGTFTIDLNGKKWEGTDTHTLLVSGGNVTVTSTDGVGTITCSSHNAIYVDSGATVHVKSGVRLNQLYTMTNANLTLDVGVIITGTFFTKADNIAPFLAGKALQSCDENGTLIEGQYKSIYDSYRMDDTGCVIVIEHKSCTGTPSTETPCPICGYDGTQTKPTEPENPNPDVAEVNGTKYKTLAEAIQAANGADITLLTIFNENVSVENNNIKAGIILGHGGTKWEVRFPSNWVAEGRGIPLTMNAGEITLKDGALAQFNTSSNTNGAIALKGGTLTVADTVTKIIGSVASEYRQYAAIEATGGVLDLQGNTLLDGGLTMSGDAQLKNKLTAGTFTNSGSEAYSVSVEGSSQYTTVFDLLETGYAFAVYNEDAPTGDVIAKDTTTRELTEDVAVIKCTHKGANNKSLFKDNTCTGCGFTCAHETIKNGVCTVCNTAMGAQDNTGKYYLNLAEAFEGVADGGTVTMLTTLKDDDTISFCCDAEGKPVEKTVTLMMNGHSLSYEGAPSLNIQSGKLIIGDEATISQPAKTAQPAVFVDNDEQSKDRGTLEFKGKANLTGGLLIQNWGKLVGGLKEGTIITSNGTYSISVERSETYGNVLGLLGDGLAFAKYDESAENKAGEIVDGSVKQLTEDVIVVAHTTHTMGKDNKCACGYTCPHNDFKDGKCTICGNGCAHTDVGDDGVCRNCQTQMAVKSETGGTVTYGTDFAAAMRNATNGTKITLLADVSIPGRTGISGDNTTVTLDLNEHKITGGWLDIGSNDNPTTCTLKIIGKGSYEPPMYGGIITVDMKATLDLSGWEGGTISAINISDSSNYDATTREAAVIVGSKAGTIGKLTFGNNQLGELKKTKLSGGSFNEIWAADHQPVKLSDLLASGYALQHEDGSYVEYGTTLQGASIYNVKVVKCPHAKINEDGHCAYCNATGFVAQVTAADGSSSAYTNIAAAIAAADGGTVKLLANAGEITISRPLKLDLNGKTAAKLTVTGEVTLASLLPEGYAFKSGSTWITDLTGKELTHVSMARIPIKSMDYEIKMSMTYGGAGTLLVKVTKETGTGAVSFQWYKVEDGKETAVGSATTKNQFDLSALKLSAGQHTFRFSATCDGYVKMSKDIVVTVQKATPIVVTVPTVAEREYNPDAALTGSDMTGGSVTGADGNELAGTWSFTGTNIVPTVNNKGYQAVFTPNDTNNYNTVTRTITVKVTKATPVIAEKPTAGALTYGQKLSDSTLTGGKATYKTADGTEVAGTFAWKNSSIQPTVADNGKTEYDVTFTPADTTNYNAVDIKLSLTVNKAAKAPNMPENAMTPAHSTKKVGDITLPDGWSWQEADKDTALADGVAVTATAVYTGADKGNYETESVSITITRSKCDHTHTEIRNQREATCKEEGYTGDTYCTGCDKLLETGEELAALGHDYQASVTKQPTTTEEGIRTYTCTRCGHSYTESIAKLTSPSPQPKGTNLKDDTGAAYKVTSANGKTPAVQYLAPKSGTKGTVTVPLEVTIDGVTYKVTSIAGNAFKGTKKIKKIVIGSNITSIGKNAFAGCTSLTSITIGKNVTKIGKNAFTGCKKLKSITIKTKKLTTKTVKKGAFNGISKKVVVKVPKSKYKTYKKLLPAKGLKKAAKIRK